jgi:RNA polymerase sigma-B factor
VPATEHRTDIELIAAHRREGNPRYREEVIKRHLGLVRSIARRYQGRGLAHEDVLQTGYVGLIQAVDRYESSRGVPLRAYAARTIEGEIMHLFRDHGWAVRVPRSLQELSRRVSAMRQRLGHELGRTPTLEELAQATGESPEMVAEAVAAQRAYTAQSLTEPARVDGGATEERLRLDPALVCEERGFESALDGDVAWRALRALPPRERQIVALRVFEGLTQSEIADRVGISQMHVSRLLRVSLEALRDRLEPHQAA